MTASPKDLPCASIAVTGIGLVSAAGSSVEALRSSLGRRQHCLVPASAFDPAGLTATHSGEVTGFTPLDWLSPVKAVTHDRGTQLALEAARQAWSQAGLDGIAASAAGVAIGVSGSPQYQNIRVMPEPGYPASRAGALYAARSTPMFQADTVARRFGLGGPRFAFGSASLGGFLALSHAMDLLRAGHAPAMLVGGGEIHTLMNALGMDRLGIASTGPCTPFAGESGICFGEGAAFFVLELRDTAEARDAAVLGELVSAGISADAYSDMGQDPGGKGLARAAGKCFGGDAVEPGTIGWIRSCGTGQRELDAAEAIGLHTAFGGEPPPLTSTEPYFGHVNGVSPLLGLAAVLVSMADGHAPAMPETAPLRPALALKILPPGPLPAGDCMLTATAFGGSNGALLIRRPGSSPAYSSGPVNGTIVIAGMGAVSPFGDTLGDLLTGLSAPPGCGEAARVRLVDDTRLRDSLPGIRMGRRDRLSRMTLLAVADALNGAGIRPRGSQRYGLLVGLTRGPLAAYERFFERSQNGVFDITTGRHLLRTGRFSVASELAHAFGLLGYSGALACGVHGGVQLLAHGAEILRASADLDGLIVVAADEWTPLLGRLYGRLNLLGDAAAYDEDASGCIGGEGAAALLLCRREPGLPAATDWAAISGTGFAGDTAAVPDPEGHSYGHAIAAAINRAGRLPEDIGFAVGQGCGWKAHDRRDLAALTRACPGTPVTSILPRTGLAEGTGGLFGAIAAASALRDGFVPGLPEASYVPSEPRRRRQARGHLIRGDGQAGNFHHAILAGSSERGAHAALVLSRMAA